MKAAEVDITIRGRNGFNWVAHTTNRAWPEGGVPVRGNGITGASDKLAWFFMNLGGMSLVSNLISNEPLPYELPWTDPV